MSFRYNSKTAIPLEVIVLALFIVLVYAGPLLLAPITGGQRVVNNVDDSAIPFLAETEIGQSLEIELSSLPHEVTMPSGMVLQNIHYESGYIVGIATSEGSQGTQSLKWFDEDGTLISKVPFNNHFRVFGGGLVLIHPPAGAEKLIIEPWG